VLRLFRHYVPAGTVFEVIAGWGIYFFAFSIVIAGAKQTIGLTSDLRHGLIAAMLAVVMVALNASLGLHQREFTSLRTLTGRALASSLIGFVLVFAMLYVPVRDGSVSLGSLHVAIPLALLAVIAIHTGIQYLQATGLGAERILIVGAGVEAETVLDTLARFAKPNYVVAGLFKVGDEPIGSTSNANLIAGQESLIDEVRKRRIDKVVVAVREKRGGVLPLRDLLECRIRGIKVMDQTQFYEEVRSEFPIESLKASWLIYSHGFEQGRVRTTVKRCFDIAAATVLLILALPVMFVTALAIRIESAGPVLYRQERVGLAGRRFMCTKFRSMRADAEKDGVARWANAGDTRITRVGRVIRKLRIDELPQFFNVLRGDMSLVGPRPERPSFVDQLKQKVPFYDVRHSVKPGLTGWAQVRFSYAASLEDSKRKLQYDLYYVKNHSLFLDVLILLETVRVVLRGEGAH
jgi:sugar transferase (PEP-CTERM system associated)